MPVIGVEQGADQAIDVAEGPKPLDLLGTDHFERHIDGVRGAAVLVVLVHPFPVGR